MKNLIKIILIPYSNLKIKRKIKPILEKKDNKKRVMKHIENNAKKVDKVLNEKYIKLKEENELITQKLINNSFFNNYNNNNNALENANLENNNPNINSNIINPIPIPQLKNKPLIIEHENNKNLESKRRKRRESIKKC